MSDDFDDLKKLWKGQPSAPIDVDVDAIESEAARFARQIKSRNLREWIAAAFVTVFFAAIAMGGDDHPPLSRLGASLIALGAVYIAYRLHRDGRVRDLPDPVQSTSAYLTAFRESLLAQARLLRAVPRWYLAPFVPGFVLYFVGLVLRQPGSTALLAAILAAIAALFAAIAWLNQRAAVELEKRARRLGTSD